MIKDTSRSNAVWNLKLLSTNARLDWIFRMVLLGLGLQMLLSFSLWWAPNGILPYLPIFFTEGQWLEQSSLVLFPVFLLLIVLNLIFSNNHTALILLLVTGVLLVFGNIHRLQIWFYFYGLILFLFLWKRKISNKILLTIVQGMVVGVYLWSGFHKFNINFVEDIFPWLIEPLGWTSSSGLAYVAAGVEVLLGLGLLFRPTRNFFVFGSFIFHLIILGLLGPLGHNWNVVVWPWNVVMPILLFFLFYKTEEIKLEKITDFFRLFPMGIFVLFLVWILPAFNYTGITPEQISFKMYSGSQPEVVLYFGEKDRRLVGDHPTVHGVLPTKTLPNYRVELDVLASAEWGTPLFITPLTAKRILHQFCQKMQRPDEGGLLYLANDDFVEMPCEKKN